MVSILLITHMYILRKTLLLIHAVLKNLDITMSPDFDMCSLIRMREHRLRQLGSLLLP